MNFVYFTIMENAPFPPTSARPSLSWNATIAMLATLFYLFTRLFIPPVVLRFLTLNEYGIWTYCFIVMSTLGMGIFGVTNVYVRYIAAYLAKKNTEKINGLVSTGVVCVGSICLLCIPLIWTLLPSIIRLFNVQPDLQAIAVHVLFLTSLIFLFDLTLGVFTSTLQSLQRFPLEKTHWSIAVVVEAAVIIIALWAGLGLYSLVLAYLIRVLLNVSLNARACYRLIPGFSISLKHFDRQFLTLFYHFGGIVQLTGILSTINQALERIFAGLYLGPAAAALYDIGEKFPIMASSLPAAINYVILPATTHLHETDLHDKIAHVYVQSSRWISILTGLMMGFLAAFSVPLITAWLGTDPKYAWAPIILAVFTLPYHCNVVTGPASAIYRGINQPLRELFYCTIQFILVLFAASFLFRGWGASFWTINLAVASMMILSVILYIYRSNHFLKVPHGEYLKRVVLPGLFPYVIGGALALAIHPWFHAVQDLRWQTLGLLAVSLALYGLILLPLYYWGILDHKEKAMLRNTLGKLLKNRI
jgi:O-antigen/teichoic acid export membrane protein